MARKILMVGAILVVLAGCDWAQFRADPGHSGFAAFDTKVGSGNVATLAQSWTGATGGAVTSSPAVAQDVAYVGSADGKLYAFDAKGVTNCTATTCAPLWTATIGGPVSSSPAYDNGVVYVGSGDGKL